jgi:repressor LexA
VRALSQKQRNIIEFVKKFWLEKSYPPTVRDILNGCGISSTSVVDYNLQILEREGYIRRHPGISRGIEIISDTASRLLNLKVPVIGQIAAGEPIPVPSADVWDTASSADTIDVPEELTKGKRDVYALRVKGLSMIDALINDGDTVLMEHVNTVENGEMAAVWLKSEKEVTLKKLYREAGRIRLQPANSQMEPIYAQPDNVEVQGKVIAVIRQLD